MNTVTLSLTKIVYYFVCRDNMSDPDESYIPLNGHDNIALDLLDDPPKIKISAEKNEETHKEKSRSERDAGKSSSVSDGDDDVSEEVDKSFIDNFKDSPELNPDSGGAGGGGAGGGLKMLGTDFLRRMTRRQPEYPDNFVVDMILVSK